MQSALPDTVNNSPGTLLDKGLEGTSYPQKKPLKIVCAALRHRRYPTRILASVRHGDPVMLSQMHPVENPHDFDSGFLDSNGAFHTREAAARVAVAAGQVAAGNELLLSEELY